MSKIDYTLWPNEGGTLGEIKVQIPTGTSNDPWPTGDALVHNFIYKDGALTGFVDNKALINNSSKTSIINYDYVRLHLENFSEGDIAFTLGERCKNFIVTYGSSDTGNSGDTVTFKYKGCTTVDEVKAVDPNYKINDIIDGVWTERLDDLENGTEMLAMSNIISFNSDLSSLTDGTRMFISVWELTSFSADLSSLTNGNMMFYSCKKLTSFNSNLSSLTDGRSMFLSCKLDTVSVQNIADTINTPTDKGKIIIGIGNTAPNEQEEAAFNTIASKNWTVYVNGSADSNIWNPTATTPIDGEQTTTPIPYWAKPVPATKETAEYVDEQGNFYNILGAQFIYGDDLSTYGMFTCEEDAAANMRLIKIEK